MSALAKLASSSNKLSLNGWVAGLGDWSKAVQTVNWGHVKPCLQTHFFYRTSFLSVQVCLTWALLPCWARTTLDLVPVFEWLVSALIWSIGSVAKNVPDCLDNCSHVVHTLLPAGDRFWPVLLKQLTVGHYYKTMCQKTVCSWLSMDVLGHDMLDGWINTWTLRELL